MNIFIDDERFPPDDGNEWLICRDYYYFVDAVIESGNEISFISFDHDLAMDETGFDCVKFLVERDMDHNILTKDFKFYVHSQNPVGKKNIEGYLNSYLDMKFGAF